VIVREHASSGTVKVLHIPYTYSPDVPGGTEVYVASLARELARRGTESVIAAPSAISADSAYVVDGILVYRLPVSPGEPSLPVLYGAGDVQMCAALLKVVSAERPDVVHFHSYTPSVNGGVAEAVRASGTAVVVTYHTPSVTCQRGTLLRFGHVVCDGRMIVERCAACVLQKNGMPRPAADLIAHVPNVIGRTIQSRGLRGGLWTALQMSELIRIRHKDTRAFLHAADLIVAVAAWVQELLLANGVNAERILLCRQGVSADFGHRERQAPVEQDDARPLRAIMLGRLDPMKGIHLPLAALDRRRDLRLSLDIYGVVQAEDEYVAAVRRGVAADSRVRLNSPVPAQDVVRVISTYDLMLIPSQVLETGPLVLLEAQAAGVPIIGTDAGGIAERVHDDIDGQLVEPGSVAAWEQALERVTLDRSIVRRWRTAVLPPPTMSDVADQMNAAYRRVARRLSHTAPAP
jgi:glycosyltransferase involved in cell wall biosynthesis